MIKKRLIELLSDAKKYIYQQVVWKWLSLLCQIIIIICITGLLAKIGSSLNDMTSGNDFNVTASAYIKFILPMGLSIILRFLFDRFETNAAFHAGANVKRILREKIYQKLLSLGTSYKKNISTAEITQLMTEGVEQLEIYFGKYLAQLFYSLLSPLTLFFVLLFISIKAAIVLLLCVPLIPLSIVLVQKIAKKIFSKYWSIYAGLGDHFLENLQGLTTLKVYQSDEKYAEEMDKDSENFRNITMKVLTMQLNSTSVMDIMAYGGSAVGMIVALTQYFQNEISFFGALMILLLSYEFFLPMRRLGSFFHIAMNGMAASDKIFHFLDLAEPQKGTKDFPENNATVSFTNVYFSYTNDLDETTDKKTEQVPEKTTSMNTPDNIGLVNKIKEQKAALRNVSMTFQANNMSAVAGVSGSGKSTIAALLTGREKGYRGSIKIGDTELSEIKEESLFSHVTLVCSNSYLVKGTVCDNLRMGAPDCSVEQMNDVLAKVDLLSFLAQNNGVDTMLTEGGSNFSGGQRQRLALARALLHDTPIYIFDEATSNIDIESENIIMDVIRKLSANHTVLLISHRLANLVNTDHIYMLKDGQIAEHGTHKELINHFRNYYFLFEAQKKLELYSGGKSKKEELPIRQSGTCSVEISELSKDSNESSATTAFVKEDAISASSPQKSLLGNKERVQVMFQLIHLLTPLIPIMLLAVLLGILGFSCAIFLTVFAAQILTQCDGQTNQMTTGLGMILLLLAAARGFLHYGEQYCNHFIAFKLLAIIRHKVFAALRNLAPAKLETRDKGNIISIVTSDIEMLEVFYAHTISPIAIALILSLVMIVFEGSIHPAAAVIAFCAYVAVGIALPIFISKSNADISMQYRNNFGDLNSFVLESLRSLDETLQYHNGDARKREIRNRSNALMILQQSISNLQGMQSAVANLMIQIATWLMLILMVYECTTEHISFGLGVVAVVAIMGSFGPVVAVSNLSGNINQTLASGSRVLALLNEKPTVTENTAGQEISTPIKNIFTEHLDFSYDQQSILKNIDIAFPKGQIIGIHGPSGCGKSTLLKLLMRFFDADEGHISFVANTISSSESKKISSTPKKIPLQEKTILEKKETDPENVKKPMSAIEMLKQMQEEQKKKEEAKKENELREASAALQQQKEEARKQTIVKAAEMEQEKKMTLAQRAKALFPKKEEMENAADIKEIKTRCLRDLESYVTQETYLFRDTIERNIAVGKPGATKEEIQAAAKKASIHEFIESLPQQYETQVGELGDTLSSGEKQRIGLARAFLHDAPILLLDEPTSALDSLNEGIILKALDEERKDKMIILVSHRESTMAIADNVYRFDKNTTEELS